jgi:hypothetical protein
MTASHNLTTDQFSATFGGRMIRIDPEGSPPCDIWSYFDRIPEKDFERHDCSEGTITNIWENGPGTFQHILVNTEDPDIFMVVVVELSSASVMGHHLLDLKKEYGLESTA